MAVPLATPPVLTSVRSAQVAFWEEHRTIVAIAVAFVGVSHLLGPAVGWVGMSSPFRVYGWLYAILWALTVAALPILLLVRRFLVNRESPDLPMREAWREVLRRAATNELGPRRLAGLAVVWLAFPPCLATFLAWKKSIPRLQPFAWDARLAWLDAALHGGQQPWTWLAPLLDAPAAVRALDLLYGPVWLLVVPALPFVVAWAPHGPLRRRFLVAYLLMWIVLGVGAAIALSSAGPCFVSWAAPDVAPAFAELNARLAALDAERQLVAVNAQRALVSSGVAAVGISAMPSLHVASVTLVAMAAWRIRPWLGAVATTYAALVLLGSVVLGWHYAVDGYASILAMAGIWWLAGRLTGGSSAPDAPGAGRVYAWRVHEGRYLPLTGERTAAVRDSGASALIHLMSAPPAAPERATASVADRLRDVWRDHRAPALVVLAYALGSIVVARVLGLQPRSQPVQQLLFFFAKGALLLACLTAFVTTWQRFAIDRASGGSVPSREAWRQAWSSVRTRHVTDAVAARTLVVYLLLAVTSMVFVGWKPLVADFGFTWDAPLVRWEAALHGGRQPWELLQPALGEPWVTRVIDGLYGYGWSASQSLLMFGLAIAAPAPWRTRALVTFALTWMLGGTLGAIALSSAGPIFLERVHGDATFAPLIAYLERVHADGGLNAIQVRDYLWAIHARGTAGAWSGISAMPSMHVASTAVLAVALHAATRGTRWAWTRWLGWGFLAVILLGSVHLAWHYALDGYLAIAGVLALWWTVGWFVPNAAADRSKASGPFGSRKARG